MSAVSVDVAISVMSLELSNSDSSSSSSFANRSCSAAIVSGVVSSYTACCCSSVNGEEVGTPQVTEEEVVTVCR